MIRAQGRRHTPTGVPWRNSYVAPKRPPVRSGGNTAFVNVASAIDIDIDTTDAGNTLVKEAVADESKIMRPRGILRFASIAALAVVAAYLLGPDSPIGGSWNIGLLAAIVLAIAVIATAFWSIKAN